MHSVGTVMRVIWRSGKRAAVFVAGVVLVVVGLVMFVTPGPGIVLVVAGLATLSTEFAWADHLLGKARRQAARAGRSARRLPGVTRATSAAGRLVPRRGKATPVAAGAGTATTETGRGVDHATAGAAEPTVTGAGGAADVTVTGAGGATEDLGRVSPARSRVPAP